MPALSIPRIAFARFRSAQSSHPRLFQFAFIGLLATILLVMSLQYISKANKPAYTGQQTRSAFLRWRSMILDVFDGVNVYTGLNEYPNPPVMAIVLRPFVELPPILGAMAWFYAKVIMAVLAARWIFRLVRPSSSARKNQHGNEAAIPALDPGPSSRKPFYAVSDLAKAAAILIALPALMGDLSHNNVNIFILFLLTACLELRRRGRDVASGIVLALAIACKVTPVLFLVYFCWKRAWRVCAGCLLGLLLWLVVVPGAAFGWNQNAQLLTDWYKLMVERPILKGEVATEHPNQALPGFIYRVFTHSPSFISYVEPEPDKRIPFPAAYHNIFDIGRPAAWMIVKALTAAFVLTVFFFCRAPRTDRQGWRFATECALIVLGMLMFSERTWKHHAVTLLFPAAVLAHAASLNLPERTRRVILGILAIAWLLISLPGLFSEHLGDLALVYGTHTIAFLLLTIGICILLARRNRLEPLPARNDNLYGLGGRNGMDKPVGLANPQ